MNKKVQALIFSTLFATSSSLVGVSLDGIAHAEMNLRTVEVQEEIKSQSIRGYELLAEAERITKEREEAERLEAERLAKEEAERLEQERLKAIEEENRRAQVGVNLENVLEISHITEDELIAVFDFYEYSHALKDIAWIFVEAEKTYGINAFIMASIASWESDYGRSPRAIYDKNYLGWGVTSASATGINSSSAYENIMGAAQFLREEYLSENGLYYNGVSTWGLMQNYCRDEYGNPSDAWRVGVNSIACEYLWIYNYLNF